METSPGACVRAVTGHDDAVTPVGVRAHPLVFGEQVALHSATGGRIEQGGIDDVHGACSCDRLPKSEYRGVAVLRPVSADSVPHVDEYLHGPKPLPGSRSRPHLFPVRTAAELDTALNAVDSKVIAWRRDFHQHPELSNREVRTAKIVAEHLRKLGLAVETGIAHTGVVGLLKTGQPGPTIALRADMDALPVVERTDVPFRSTAKSNYRGEEVGVMHACGHDSHTAVLMGVAEALVKVRAHAARQRAVRVPAGRGRRAARRRGRRVDHAEGGPVRALQAGGGVRLACLGIAEYRDHRLSQRALHGRLTGLEGGGQRPADPWLASLAGRRSDRRRGADHQRAADRGEPPGRHHAQSGGGFGGRHQGRRAQQHHSRQRGD